MPDKKGVDKGMGYKPKGRVKTGPPKDKRLRTNKGSSIKRGR